MRDELDDVTLARAVRGEDAARLALVRRYQGLVFSVVNKVVGKSSSETADLAQESFLRVLRGLGTFDPRRGVRLSTWIATVAVRTAIDHVRVRGRVVSLDALRAEGASPESAVDADETSLDTKRRAEHLARALGALTAEHRAVVLLRFEADLSLEAIAAELGIGLGTVKSRLSRAREALRQAVDSRENKAEGT